MGTCDPCLDGRHTRCKRSGCSCNICRTPKAEGRVRAVVKARKRTPAKPKPGAETDLGSTKPWTEADKDRIAADILKLCQAIRMRQIKDTAEYELRETLKAMAVAHAEKVADGLLGLGDDVDDEARDQGDVQRQTGAQEPGADLQLGA